MESAFTCQALNGRCCHLFCSGNLRNGREMGDSFREFGLQARWSVLVLCTCRVPHFGVFVVFLRFAFSLGIPMKSISIPL